MKKFLFIALIFLLLSPQNFTNQYYTLISWNISDFGKTKDSIKLKKIAEVIGHADVVAIQEVVTSEIGEKKIIELIQILNHNDSIWEYNLSERTVGDEDASERYAFLWKTSKIDSVSDGILLNEYVSSIDREPYYITFYTGRKAFSVMSLHIRPQKSKKTESEIRALTEYPEYLQNQASFVVGDFNLNQIYPAFNNLRSLDYLPTLRCELTTFKDSLECSDYLSEGYDNIFYSKGLNIKTSRVNNYINNCEEIYLAKGISDHLPVETVFSID